MAEKWCLVVALLCMHVFATSADNKPQNIIPFKCSRPELLPHPAIEDIQDSIEVLAYLDVYKPEHELSRNDKEKQAAAQAIATLTKAGLPSETWKMRVCDVVNLLREKNKIIAASYHKYFNQILPETQCTRLEKKEPKGRILSQALLSNGMVLEQFEAYKVLVPKAVHIFRGTKLKTKEVVLIEKNAQCVENLRVGNHSLRKTFFDRNGECVVDFKFVTQKD